MIELRAINHIDQLLLHWTILHSLCTAYQCTIDTVEPKRLQTVQRKQPCSYDHKLGRLNLRNPRVSISEQIPSI